MTRGDRSVKNAAKTPRDPTKIEPKAPIPTKIGPASKKTASQHKTASKKIKPTEATQNKIKPTNTKAPPKKETQPTPKPPIAPTPAQGLTLPSSFEGHEDYRRFFAKLVLTEQEADRVATELSIENLSIKWDLQFHKSTGQSNFVMSFPLPLKERGQYKIKNGTYVQWFHDDLPDLSTDVRLYGYVAHLSPIKPSVHIVIDQNVPGVGAIVSSHTKLPRSGWTMKLLFDPTTYERMQLALDCIKNFPPSLAKVFFGGSAETTPNQPRTSTTTTKTTTTTNNDWRHQSTLFGSQYLPPKVNHAPSLNPLNEYQERAIELALTRPLLSITGPPGTGKSTTLSNLVYHIHQVRGIESKAISKQYHEQLNHIKNPYDLDEMINKVRRTPPPPPYKPGPILVCAPSNVATNHLAGLLLKIPGLDVLRVSSKRYQALNYATQDDEVENSALHHRIESWMLANPDSELAILHKATFSHLQGSDLQTLGAKLDSVFNDDHFFVDDQAKAREVADLGQYRSSPKFIQMMMTRLGGHLAQGLHKNKLAENQRWAILYSNLQTSIIKQADVVCCTFALCGNQLIFNRIEFPYVILDEVSQSTEPQLLLPLSFKPQSLVLFGDRQQLGPVVNSKDPLTKAGLERSLFSRLILTNACPNITLNIQYRMHPMIAEYSSKEFYEGKLENGVGAHQRESLLNLFPWPNPKIPIAFLSTAGAKDCVQVWQGPSAVNVADARQTVRIVAGLVKQGTSLSQIGIVVPYRAQANQLIQMFCNPEEEFCKLVIKLYCINDDAQINTPHWKKQANYLASVDKAIELIQQQLEIDTVDAYQGREKSLMIFNIVRTSPAAFLTPNRLNVALTRAQNGLIVIGCHTALKSKDKMFANLLSLFSKYNAFVDYRGVQDLLHTKFNKVISATLAQQSKAQLDRLKQERENERKQAEVQILVRPYILRPDAQPFIPRESQEKL